uniref:Glycosyl transferase group 1 n=1 Tax=Geobacter sp. (strain M21) TaxID=443144 RepID=C6DZV7_GEOSM
MKILFCVFQALLGGHVLSASTVAREMQSCGHEVVFAGKEGRMSPIIAENIPFFPVEIPIYQGDRETYFTWSSLHAISELRSLIREQQVDLVHAFDARSYFHCYPAALLEGVPVLCTLCGGVDPYYNLPRAPKLIVFSEEQKAKMVRQYRWEAGKVEVVRTRLDLGRIQAREAKLDDDLMRQTRLISGVPKIMMISSFDDSKIASIYNALDAVESLLSGGRRVQAVFIGGKGPLHDQVKERAQKINAHFGIDSVVLTGPIVDAFRLLQVATVVLGVGRSAFEGMVYGKPTIVVGRNGFAGVVAPEGIDEIAYYNFSGRNQGTQVPPTALAAEIAALLDDPGKAASAGDFGRDFVMREIDVKCGAARIEAIYRGMMAPSSMGSLFLNAASFIKSLVPIAYDNAAHRPKTYIKKLIRNARMAG